MLNMFLDFFSKPSSVGISISDEALHIVEMNMDEEIIAYSTMPLEDGTVRLGKIVDREKLSLKLQEGLAGAYPKPIDITSKNVKTVVGLPESDVFLYAFYPPADVKEGEMAQRVSDETSAIVPFDPKDMIWSYQKYSKKIVAAGVLKNTVDVYIDVMKHIGLQSVVVDMESVALGRSLLKRRSSQEAKCTMIVDISARSTLLAIFDNEAAVNLSIIVPFGGSDMVMIVAEIKNALRYYQDTFGEAVVAVILSGDLSYVPNATELLSKDISVEVHPGKPFAQIKNTQLIADFSQPLLYAKAVGFALRNCPSAEVQNEVNLGA